MPPHHDIIYGMNPVREVLKSGRREVQHLWCAPTRSGAPFNELRVVARQRGVRMEELGAAQLQQKAQTPHHQGVVAQVGPYRYVGLEDVLSAPDVRDPLLVLLDCVQDPHNFGAVLRTALGCGAAAVIVPKDRSVAVTGAVVRASAGASEWIPIVQVINLVNSIKILKDNNIWVSGLEVSSAQSLYEYAFTGGQAVIFGNEGEGMRRLVRERCDTLLSIPIAGPVDSYNVSVAAAMVLGEASRQRKSRQAP